MIEIDEIKAKLRRYYTWIETNIKIENSLGLTNLNISLEDFICKLLKIIRYGDFENCNDDKVNYANIDLINSEGTLGIQITSETSSKKIRDTIDNNAGNYKIVFFFLASDYMPTKKTLKSCNLNKENIMNFSKCIEEIKDLDIVNDVYKYFEDHLMLPVKFEKIETNGYNQFIKNFILNDIKAVCENFVPTKTTYECLERLNSANKLVLIGSPGVGKTYTCKYLVGKFLEDGYKLLYFSDTLKESFENYNGYEKAVLFIDDIFGSNEENVMQKLKESELEALFKRNDNNFKIIVNSRINIYNEAKQKYSQIKYLNLETYIKEMQPFSAIEKAKILIKHFQKNTVNVELIRALFDDFDKSFEDTKIFKLISHDTFNPRLIDESLKFYNGNECLYLTIKKVFDNPTSLYDDFCLNNLQSCDLKVLQIIYLLIPEYYIECDLSTLYEYSRKIGLLESDVRTTIKKIEKNFINIFEKVKNGSSTFALKYINPGIMDYFRKKFNDSNDMKNYLEIINDKHYLKGIMMNEKISDSKKMDKAIETNLDDLTLLAEIDKSTVCNNQKYFDYYLEQIKKSNYLSGSVNCYIDENHLEGEKFIELISNSNNISKFIDIDMRFSASETLVRILKNFLFFSEGMQDKIVENIGFKISDDCIYAINSEIEDLKYDEFDCDEESLSIIYDDYFDRRVEWIKKVGVKQNIVIGDDFLNALTLEKNFDYDDYSDSIYEAFHDNSNDLGDSTNNDVKCYLNEYRNSLSD